MRPISVEFQAFGPYKDKELVDFEKLAKKGLFLICGETGSGKTMILDAITYALYGKSSGSQREDLQSSRCKNAEWGVDTYVDFKFEANGKIYRFERRLECKRSNLSTKQNAYIVDESGNSIPLFENCKDADMRKKAVEIIGMDYDQFRQVILLPQGQFEKLLTADSSEKEAVLTNIFGVDKWSKIAGKVYDNAEQHLSVLKKEKEQIIARLMDDDCETVTELENNIALLKKELVELNSRYEAEGNNEKKEQLLKIRECLLENEKTISELESRTNAKSKAEKQLENNKNNVVKLSEKHQLLIEEKEAVESEKMLITRYEDKREYYENYSKLSDNCLRKKEEYSRYEKVVINKSEELNKKREEQLGIGENVKKLNEQYTILLTRYIDGIVGGLAKDLEDGKPCPVCGSVTHPNKAKALEDVVSKLEVDKKKKEASAEEKKFEDVNKQVLGMEKELLECENSKQKQKNLFELAMKEVALAAEQLIPEADTIEVLEKLISDKKKYVANYEQSLEDARSEVDKMKNQQADIEGKLKILTEEIEKTKEKQAKGLETIKELFDAYGETIDINSCDERIKDIEYNQRIYTQQKTKYEVLISSKSKKVEELRVMEEHYNSEISNAEADHAFAKSLRGDTGIGLQRYVLGIMFSSVIVAANKMLEKVHGGRYRLYRTDEKVKGSNKKGLELFVYDSFLGDAEGRSVKTLSGGEKFLVSLALSIGLSTVARRSGIHLDAMFIDEGFGSLDQNSIEDAMDILMGIQKANGTVGIISHVQLLKDNIPTKLEIVKTKEGSRIIKD